MIELDLVRSSELVDHWNEEQMRACGCDMCRARLLALHGLRETRGEDAVSDDVVLSRSGGAGLKN